MNIKKAGRYAILGVLFFLPVTFLILLYPATHHYIPLDIVKDEILDLEEFTSHTKEDILLKDNITVLGFLGEKPNEMLTASSNLKELVYDKFKGFKKFQLILVSPFGAEEDAKQVKKNISLYEDTRFLHLVFGSKNQITKLFNSLKYESHLNENYATENVFIIDKDLNQRGRIDDREDNEKEKNTPIYGLNSYNCIEVATIKNKMSEDLRILFTEYRQKRKNEFNSTIRRANDLKGKNNEAN